jgi:hypothetical protein
LKFIWAVQLALEVVALWVALLALVVGGSQLHILLDYERNDTQNRMRHSKARVRGMRGSHQAWVWGDYFVQPRV